MPGSHHRGSEARQALSQTGQLPTQDVEEPISRACRPGQFLLVSGGGTRAAGADQPPPGAATRGALMTALAPALQAYFTDRLISQRNSSPETIAAYRDAFRLLLRFAADRTGKQPFELDIDDLDAPLIGSFLKH